MSRQTYLIDHNEAFALIQDEENGVKAWDILMERYDSRVFNEASRRADDLSALLKIKLDSIKVGAFNSFISKFKDTAAHVKLEGKKVPQDFLYDLLIQAIQHPSYDMFLTTARTRSPQYSYRDFISALQLYASQVEKRQGPASDPNNNRSVSL